MAKILSNIGITTNDTIKAGHVTQSVDALTGTDAYDISISGSLVITGPLTGIGDISSSADVYGVTGSFLHLEGDGSDLTGITAEWDGSHNGNASITGSLTVTGNISSSANIYSEELITNQLTSTGRINRLARNFIAQNPTLNPSVEIELTDDIINITNQATIAPAVTEGNIDITTWLASADVGTVVTLMIKGGSGTENITLKNNNMGEEFEVNGSLTTNVTYTIPNSQGTNPGSFVTIQKRPNGAFGNPAISIWGSDITSGGGSGIFTQTGSFYATTNDLQVTGSLTATGDISSSTNVYGVTGSFSHLQGNSPITVQDSITFQSAITASGDISGSSTATSSFGAYVGDGSGLTGTDISEVNELIVEGNNINTLASASYGINVIETGSLTDFCCKLPIAKTGRSVTIINKTTIPINVFPSAISGSINGNEDGFISLNKQFTPYTFYCIENPLPGGWSFLSPTATSQIGIPNLDPNTAAAANYLEVSHVNGGGITQAAGWETGFFKSSPAGLGIDVTPSGGVLINNSFNAPTYMRSEPNPTKIVKYQLYTNITAADLASAGNNPVIVSLTWTYLQAANSAISTFQYFSVIETPNPFNSNVITEEVTGGMGGNVPIQVGDNGTLKNVLELGVSTYPTNPHIGQIGTSVGLVPGTDAGYWWCPYIEISTNMPTGDWKFKIIVDIEQ